MGIADPRTEERKVAPMTGDSGETKKQSTLEKFHLGFIAKLIGRDKNGNYASEEEHEADGVLRLKDAR